MTDEQLQADAVLEHTLQLLDALAYLVGPESIGQPLGEGIGLEAAIAATRRTFTGIDEVREAGCRLAVSIITTKSIAPPDVNAVMGVDVIEGGELPPAQAEAARALGGAAVTFLGQVGTDGANIWELWKRNDEVAEELLCWHLVAWGRLMTLGKVPPL